MPIHISGSDDITFNRSADIHVKGKPHFKQKVSVSESRFMAYGRRSDKYKKILSLFDSGVYFCQPQNKIMNFEKSKKGKTAIEEKVARFINNITDMDFDFSKRTGKKPKPNRAVANGRGALQVEFYLDNANRGKMRLTNHSTVVCKSGEKYDYMIDVPGSMNKEHKQYNIYGYHYRYTDAANIFLRPRDYDIEDSHVTNEVRTAMSSVPIRSEKGGQIYVDGDVIIGGETVDEDGRGSNIIIDENGTIKWYEPKFKGKLTIVATGNIWIVNSIEYDGPMEKTPEGFDVPAADNPNILGLFAQNGVVKIVDPGQLNSTPPKHAGLEYSPIGLKKTGSTGKGRGGGNTPYMRQLPNPMVVHAAITAGGGAWGAENAAKRQDTINIDPRNPENMLDDLVVAGSITEILGDITSKGDTGYKKHYYFDKRLLEGILPGDVWLQSKFTPKPGGWSDYRL